MWLLSLHHSIGKWIINIYLHVDLYNVLTLGIDVGDFNNVKLKVCTMIEREKEGKGNQTMNIIIILYFPLTHNNFILNFCMTIKTATPKELHSVHSDVYFITELHTRAGPVIWSNPLFCMKCT